MSARCFCLHEPEQHRTAIGCNSVGCGCRWEGQKAVEPPAVEPPKCSDCRAPLTLPEQAFTICPSCWVKLGGDR